MLDAAVVGAVFLCLFMLHFHHNSAGLLGILFRIPPVQVKKRTGTCLPDLFCVHSSITACLQSF